MSNVASNEQTLTAEGFYPSSTDEYPVEPDQVLDTYGAASKGVEEIDEWPLDTEGTLTPGSVRDHGTPIHRDHASGHERSSDFRARNAEAIPVYERASEDFTTGDMILSSSQGPQMIAGRRRGRKYLLLEVPTSWTGPQGAAITPLGILFGRDPGEVAAGKGWQLNVGDSIELDTEAPVYAAPLPGASSGTVLFAEFFNLVGGPVAP